MPCWRRHSKAAQVKAHVAALLRGGRPDNLVRPVGGHNGKCMVRSCGIGVTQVMPHGSPCEVCMVQRSGLEDIAVADINDDAALLLDHARRKLACSDQSKEISVPPVGGDDAAACRRQCGGFKFCHTRTASLAVASLTQSWALTREVHGREGVDAHLRAAKTAILISHGAHEIHWPAVHCSTLHHHHLVPVLDVPCTRTCSRVIIKHVQTTEPTRSQQSPRRMRGFNGCTISPLSNPSSTSSSTQIAALFT